MRPESGQIIDGPGGTDNVVLRPLGADNLVLSRAAISVALPALSPTSTRRTLILIIFQFSAQFSSLLLYLFPSSLLPTQSLVRRLL